MKSLYSSPLRVYLCLGALALAGLYAGFSLPVSLFPNSSKPTIGVDIPYGHYTVTDFIRQHGDHLQTQLRTISTEAAEVEKTKVHYNQSDAHFEIEFKWGSASRSALKEVETVVYSYSSQFSDEIRNQIWIYPQNSNSGFFAVSFYSNMRSLDELYKLLEPVIMPPINKLRDVSKPHLWNPTEKEIRIELDQNRMAAFQLMPKDIDQTIRAALTSSNGGSITLGVQQLPVQVPKVFSGVDDLHEVLISTPSKQFVHLTDVAKIDFDIKTTNTNSFKTSGTPSLILFSRPRPGGNVKRMSEEMLQVIQSSMATMPKDISYKVLVDPSEFIRSAINNVFHEVAIGAFLAVLVLFFFIGSFKNTVTAAIEIPLSMVMAFIPMKLSGMSINLISLGGLALSAGMNVDASVVVMENIFRHFENTSGPLDSKGKLKLLIRAVREVKFSVIASTIASLVVFLPLAFTSDLSYAILGDLAKAVVFSHGFSAFVALILVPTVRLHLMSRGVEKVSHSPIEKQITWIEDAYVKILSKFIQSKNIQRATYFGVSALLVVLAITIIPILPKEVIGKPDTDWVEIGVTSQGNTLLRQMEETTAEIEAKMMGKFGSQIQYTFTQVYQPNQSWIMARLHNKNDMRKIWKEMEAVFVNTPFLKFMISPWNPAELPIPNPPHMRLTVRGGKLEDRSIIARDLYQVLEENQVFPRLWSEPVVTRSESVLLKPYLNVWSTLRSRSSRLDPSDLADIVRVMTTGKKIGDLMIDGVKRDVYLRYAGHPNLNTEEIGSIPIGFGEKIVPLRALNRVEIQENVPAVYEEDQRELYVILGKMNEGDPVHLVPQKLKKAEEVVEKWKKEYQSHSNRPLSSLISFEVPDQEVHDAMTQLLVAVGLSVALIFLILLIQFGDFMNALLVLIAIPLGLIGVLTSLFVFQSTLSLNSILGVILLNGIAVANSIILVDFLKQRVDQGLTPTEAALDAAKKRLRPILITSLTTILGMLPVALGFGEGGRILQPLGIAVSGGLWVSMGLTLLIVPTLQVRYLDWKKAHAQTI